MLSHFYDTKFTIFSIKKLFFFGKIFGVSIHLGHSERMFNLVNYSFPSKGVLHSLINRLELQDHLFSKKVTEKVKKETFDYLYFFGI